MYERDLNEHSLCGNVDERQEIKNQETPPLTIGSDIFQSLCGETLREIMSITFSSSDQEEKQLTDISTMMIINSKQY